MRHDEFIAIALREDLKDGDHTSLSCIPSDSAGSARLLVKDSGILSGMDVAREVFRQVDDRIRFEPVLKDGDHISVGDVAFYVHGSNQRILQGERLALNLMQRMSGIATTTSKYVEAVRGTNAQILDTRKTTPNLRQFEKAAVLHGGGTNHRFGLYDMVMIKDNHVDFAGGIEKALKASHAYLKANEKDLKIEIETRNLEEVAEVLRVGIADRIMLDNFDYKTTHKAVKLIGGQMETESSGGITLDTIRGYAECGVDYISVGALTHSVKSLDLSLKAM